MINTIKSIFKIFLSLILLTFLFEGCVLDSLGGKPVAKLSCNVKEVQVGGYCILDSEGSNSGEGDKLIYKWEESENNPAHTVFVGWEKQNIGFTVAGTYTYYLTINNGIENSNTKKVEITVNPREGDIFEDPALEAQVRCTLGMPTEELTNESFLIVDSLRGVTASTRDIYSLNGLDKCTNMKFLEMALQNITNISEISDMVDLEYLCLSQNRKIEDISALQNLTKLKELDLMANIIKDISPLLNLTNLEYLHMTENPIEDLSPLRNLYNLEELWISYVKDNDLSFIKDLDKLYLFWMGHSNLDNIYYLSDRENLSAVNLSYNKISDISPLMNLKKLELIYLNDNNIEDISALENLINVKRIVMPGNNIKDITPLVNNAGLGEGDLLVISDNPLNEQAYNEYIPALIARGVTVYY